MTAKRKWTVNDGTIQRQRPFDSGEEAQFSMFTNI